MTGTDYSEETDRTARRRRPTVTWGQWEDVRVPGAEPAQTVSKRSTRWVWVFLALLVGALIVTMVLPATNKDSRPSGSSSGGGAYINADDGLGIGYGTKVNSDWLCGVVDRVTFACAGSTGTATAEAGGRGQYDIASRFDTGVSAVIRYDSSRWRCDAAMTATGVSRRPRGITCTQRY